MLFADLPLARRLERAALLTESEFARTYASLKPEADVEVAEIADGRAIYTGHGSPMSQATAFGMNGPITDEDMAALESVYFRRSAPARVVFCPLADDSLLQVVNRRGYRPAEFENTMVRTLGHAESGGAPPDIQVRLATPDEADVYAHVVGSSFAEDGVVTPDMRDMMSALFAMRTAHAFLGLVDGVPAGGGALIVNERVAMLAGAATLPAFRNRGVQTALFHARLADARALGCDLAVVGVRPGSGSQRNAERKGFRVAYTKVVLIRDRLDRSAL